MKILTDITFLIYLFCFQDESERFWFAGLIEESVHWTLEADRQTHLAELLLKSQVQYTAVKHCDDDGEI